MLLKLVLESVAQFRDVSFENQQASQDLQTRYEKDVLFHSFLRIGRLAVKTRYALDPKTHCPDPFGMELVLVLAY